MRPENSLIKCRGANCSIILYRDGMVINEGVLSGRSYRLPLEGVSSVIVGRKSVVPFATITVIAAVFTLITKYNALWFLVNLTSDSAGKLSTFGVLACIILAVPTLTRALFVNVDVTWTGQPASFHLGFVPAKMGRLLARRFQELSAGS